MKTQPHFRWPGFGTFESCQQAVRKGTHPQTGEPIKIKASTRVGFRPTTALKDKMGTTSQPKAKAKANEVSPPTPGSISTR